MSEDIFTTIVRENIMINPQYTPYCGDSKCKYRMPRSTFKDGQFECICGWRSDFEKEFIEKYRPVKPEFALYEKMLKIGIERMKGIGPIPDHVKAGGDVWMTLRTLPHKNSTHGKDSMSLGFVGMKVIEDLSLPRNKWQMVDRHGKILGEGFINETET